MNELTFAGSILGLIGSIILAFALVVSKNTIKEMVITYPGHNPTLRKELLKGRKVGLIGVGFLLCAFLLQLIGYIC